MKRRTWLTNEELERWNTLRASAGEDPIDKAMAEAVLLNVDDETYRKLVERLR